MREPLPKNFTQFILNSTSMFDFVFASNDLNLNENKATKLSENNRKTKPTKRSLSATLETTKNNSNTKKIKG